MSKPTITGSQMFERLKDIPEGSVLFVSYIAGRPPCPQALRECARADREGIAPRHFTGHLASLWVNRRGEHGITMWVEERDSADGKPGAYRRFNPSLGKLFTLEVIDCVNQP